MDAWDEKKRLSNIANHRVDFRDLGDLDWARALIFEDRRRDYGETRLIAMAPLARGCMWSCSSRGTLAAASSQPERPIAARWLFMKRKLIRPSVEDDEAIAQGIASDPDAAPDLSGPVAGVVRRPGRPRKANPKVSVTLRLDRDVIDRFKATGQGWQTRINAVLKKSKVG